MKYDEYGRIYYRKDVACECPEGWNKQFHRADCPRSVYHATVGGGAPLKLTPEQVERIRKIESRG